MDIIKQFSYANFTKIILFLYYFINTDSTGFQHIFTNDFNGLTFQLRIMYRTLYTIRQDVRLCKYLKLLINNIFLVGICIAVIRLIGG